jgi:hypothetical protein
VPYSNSQASSGPPAGFTVAFRVAELWPSDEAAPVTTVGGLVTSAELTAGAIIAATLRATEHESSPRQRCIAVDVSGAGSPWQQCSQEGQICPEVVLDARATNGRPTAPFTKRQESGALAAQGEMGERARLFTKKKGKRKESDVHQKATMRSLAERIIGQRWEASQPG